MQNKRSYPRIFLFLLLVASACQQNTPDATPAENIAPGASHLYFDQAQEAKTSEEKIAFLNRALLSIENRKDTLLPMLLDHKIYYHSRLKQYDSAFYFADSLVRAAEFQRDTAMVAMGYYRMSRIKIYTDEPDEVLKYGYESRNLYLSIKDSSNAGKRSLEIANALHDLGDYTDSQESATEALKFLDINKDSTYLSSAYNTIGLVYTSLMFYEDAIPEFRTALSYSVSLRDSLSYLNNLALVLQKNGEYGEAKEIFEDLLLKVEKDNTRSRARYLDNLAYTKWLKDPAVAVEKDLLEALQLRLADNDKEGLQASYSHLTNYFENRDTSRARKYAEDFLATSRSFGNLHNELESYKYLISLNSGETSRDYAGRYIALNDSLDNVALRAKNTFAKIKYDEERKQQEIVSLEAQNSIQKLEAQKLQSRGLTAILGAGLVILALSFLIYFLRQRHKKEKIREVQKTESRISKVIHDELANDLFNVMSSLELVVPEPVIDKLEKIYLRTRDISRENSDIDTGVNYLDYLKANLSNSSPEGSKLIISGEKTVNWEKLGEEKKIVIYRVLQELMVNMNKHSNAKLVAITFGVSNNKLNIQYYDNGCGTTWPTLKKGSGLQNVENRIKSLNGKINFESEEGKGFKVIISVPL